MISPKTFSVPWCSESVRILGLSEKAHSLEFGFQVYTADWVRSYRLENGLLLNERYSFHHSANENRGRGLKGAIAGSEAKRKGQSPGFPDWICPELGLAIELKLPNEKPRPEQLRWLERFFKIGWHSEVVFNFERFREIVLKAVQKCTN